MQDSIHQGQPVLQYGAQPEHVSKGVILLHGRGSSAHAILPLAHALAVDGAHFRIPQAGHHRWYPNSAFGALESNEPDLSSALALIDQLMDQMLEEGMSTEQIYLGGFSQGACLAAEYAARNAKGYGGLFILSGALIGPEDTPRDYPGRFDGMPTLIGSSDVDPWVPYQLVRQTSQVLKQMGAEVDFRTYPGMAHTVVQDEIDAIRLMLSNQSSE